MDQNEMRLIARYKVLLSKHNGNKIDLVKFSSDNAYAKQVLEIGAASDNEELIVVAMQLMERRGFLKKAATPEPKKEEKDGDVNDRYIGKLR
ncbi:MAG TPA: hypothetical protein VJS66_06195 [Burkholderiales bacterium]|nr:hypothetical protein [Burkholderiales bacterium]